MRQFNQSIINPNFTDQDLAGKVMGEKQSTSKDHGPLFPHLLNKSKKYLAQGVQQHF